MIRERLDLSRAALSACVRWENLGEAPLGIGESPTWRGAEAQRENDRAARAELDAYGLLDGDRAAADLRDALEVVTAPSVEYSCWAQDEAGHYRAVLTTRGKRAVLLIRNGERVLVRAADVDHPAEELVAPLPHCVPATGHALNVRRADYDAAQAGRGGNNDAQRLLTVMRQPRAYAAEFHVANRDRMGVRRRAEPRTMIDTVRGRWLIARHPGATPADDWIVATPGGHPELAGMLYEMRTTLV